MSSGSVKDYPIDGQINWEDKTFENARIIHFRANACKLNYLDVEYRLPVAEEVTVDEANPQFSSCDGVLYNKEQTTLLWYPQKKPGKSFYIPSNVQEIVDGAFTHANILEIVDGGAGLKRIGVRSFYWCDGIKEFRIMSGQYHSTDGILFDCESTALLLCPVGRNCELNRYAVTAIGEDALFRNKLICNVALPDSISAIGSGAFSFCHSLETFVGGDGLRIVGNSAFAYCKNLQTVVFQHGLASIDFGAFNHCSRLAELYIPETVTEIGYARGYSTIGKRTTVLCAKGSYAYKYAQKHELKTRTF